MRGSGIFAAALIIAGTSTGAWANHSVPVDASMAPTHQGMEMAAAGNQAVTEAFEHANDSMMKGMMAPLSGDPDRDFASRMIPHHQGAIEMAKIELQYGTDPQLKKMAEEIIAAQEKEIAQLQEWLAQNPQ